MNLKNDSRCLRSQGGEPGLEPKASRLWSQSVMIDSVTTRTTLPTTQSVFLTRLSLPKTGVYILAVPEVWPVSTEEDASCHMGSPGMRYLVMSTKGAPSTQQLLPFKICLLIHPHTESALGVTSTSRAATWSL